MRTRTIQTKAGKRTSRLYSYQATWTKRGFLKWEAEQLQLISKRGHKAPYLQEMIARRQALLQDAKDQKITKRQYRRLVYEEYAKMGINPRMFQKRDAKGRFMPYVAHAFWEYYHAYRRDKSTWWRDPKWIDTPREKKEPIIQDFQPPKGARAKQKAEELDALFAKQLSAKNRGDKKEHDKLEREIRGRQGRL